MASVKFNKDSPEFKLLNEFWAFLQKFYIPEDTDEYWQAFIVEYDEFIRRHPGDELARQLLKAFQIYLEKQLKIIQGRM